MAGRPRSALLLEDVANPYSAAVQRAVEDEATPRGVLVFSGSLDEDPARERELAARSAPGASTGCCWCRPATTSRYLEREVRAGTAIVCVDREARGLPVDSVITTNATGAAEGVRHLAAGRPPADRLPRRPAHDPHRAAAVRGLPRRRSARPASRSTRALVVHDLRDPLTPTAR